MAATRIIAVINQKGGTAKTTTSLNLGAGLSRAGRRVLLVDMDPQGGLSYALGIRGPAGPTIYEVLKGKAGVAEAIRRHDYPGGGYDFIPANVDLEGAELEIVNVPGREMLLRRALDKVKGNYDYVIIDSPPRLTVLTINALTAANELFIPLLAEYLPLNGMRQLIQTLDLVRENLGYDIAITGVITTLYNSRKTSTQNIIDMINGLFGPVLFDTKIRVNAALSEAPSAGMDIFEYKPSSNGAKDYMALTKEVINQEKGAVR